MENRLEGLVAKWQLRDFPQLMGALGRSSYKYHEQSNMTSTNVFQGMHGNKNSSKVIKPPGGGHTDIFGAPDPPVKRDSGRNASSITEGTNAGVQSPAAPKAPVPQPQPQTQPQPKSEAPAAAGRVPPGGFSSGPFW
ncbi:hypothetical protein HUJ05_007229 [Dendroctonus ponderosae]|nr:hypothetical protein HUJ05_007229 [Dendroctonus ponderosae]